MGNHAGSIPVIRTKIGKYRQIFADFYFLLFTLHFSLSARQFYYHSFKFFCSHAQRLLFSFYKADAALGYLFFEVDYLHFVGKIYELLGHESDSEIRLRHRENLICRCRFDVRAVRQTVLGEERRIKLE